MTISVCLYSLPLYLLLLLKFQMITSLPIMAGTYIYDLHSYSTLSLEAMISEWNVNSLTPPASFYAGCPTENILGGYGKLSCGNQIERTYTSLPQHEMISIDITVYLIDQWTTGNTINFMVDGTSVITITPSGIIAESVSDLCGSSSDPDFELRIIGNVVHSGSSLTLSFDSSPANAQAFFGITNVRISLRQSVKPHLSVILVAPPTAVSVSLQSQGFSSCGIGQYADASGNCQICSDNCDNCFGPSASECYSCTLGDHSYDVNTDTCVQCTTGCILCSGPDANQCGVCSGTDYTNYWDHTCQDGSICLAGYAFSDSEFFQFCKTPCQATNQYTLPDNSCVDTCEFFLEPSIEGDGKFCVSPCGIGNYLYWNGLCEATCFHPRFHNDVIFCDACQLNHYLYPNKQCFEECPAPFKKRSQGVTKFCDYPCDDADMQFYYEIQPNCRKTCDSPYKIQNDIFCVLDIPTEQADQVKTISRALRIINSITRSVGISISLINFSNPTALFIECFAEMLRYLKYLNIKYPPKLQHLTNLKIDPLFKIIPDMPENMISQIPKYNLWLKFEENEDLHSSFLINFWKPLIVLLGLTIGIFLITGIAYATKSCKHVQWLCSKVLATLKWNFSLSLFTSYFGDIAFYSAFELATDNPNTPLQILSFVLCFLINLLVLLVLGKIIAVIRTRRSLLTPSLSKRNQASQSAKISKEALEQRFNSYQVIFKEYKDQRLVQQIFFCLIISRIYIFMGVIAYLYAYPLAQTIILSLVSLSMLLYLLIVRPLKSLIYLFQYVLQELVTLTAVASALALSILDTRAAEDYKTREVLGDIIIGCEIAFSCIGGLYLLIQVIFTLKAGYKSIKMYRNYKKKDKVASNEMSPMAYPQNNQSASISVDQPTRHFSRAGKSRKPLDPLNNDSQLQDSRLDIQSRSYLQSPPLLAKEIEVDQLNQNKEARFVLETLEHSPNETLRRARRAELRKNFDISGDEIFARVSPQVRYNIRTRGLVLQNNISQS